MSKRKRTLRDMFHVTANKMYIPTMAAVFIRQMLIEDFKDVDLPAEKREVLDKIISDLGKAEKKGLVADKMFKTIKDIVYERINPDEIIIEWDDDTGQNNSGK
ncbi:MAG: hypothetical protein ABH858_02585 [Candidatus Omnitrophota bacterium]